MAVLHRGVSKEAVENSLVKSDVAEAGVARELALTARTIDGAEAERVCLVSRCFADEAAMLAAAEQTAVEIAAKSPVAVTGTKRIMLHSRRGSLFITASTTIITTTTPQCAALAWPVR